MARVPRFRRDKNACYLVYACYFVQCIGSEKDTIITCIHLSPHDISNCTFQQLSPETRLVSALVHYLAGDTAGGTSSPRNTSNLQDQRDYPFTPTTSPAGREEYYSGMHPFIPLPLASGMSSERHSLFWRHSVFVMTLEDPLFAWPVCSRRTRCLGVFVRTIVLAETEPSLI